MRGAPCPIRSIITKIHSFIPGKGLQIIGKPELAWPERPNFRLAGTLYKVRLVGTLCKLYFAQRAGSYTRQARRVRYGIIQAGIIRYQQSDSTTLLSLTAVDIWTPWLTRSIPLLPLRQCQRQLLSTRTSSREGRNLTMTWEEGLIRTISALSLSLYNHHHQHHHCRTSTTSSSSHHTIYLVQHQHQHLQM